MKHRRITAVGVALFSVGAGLLTAGPASAAQVKTHVVVELNGSSVTSISMNVGDPDVTLMTHMDGKCLSAVEHAQNKSFGIAPSDDNSAVATLAPSLGYSGLECTSPPQSWTVHAVANGDATLRFDPVVTDNGSGLQKQMAGTSVQVHVGQGGIPNPPGHENPAAPAVTNAHVPHGSALADTCKAHYSGAKNWHGRLIKDVAHWARDNGYNKTKDTYSDIAWSNLVTGYVDSLCNSPATT
jgi:hypothetical protein